MEIRLITHPPTMMSQSMPRFASYLAKGMEARGHSVKRETSPRFFSRWQKFAPGSVRKWLGYLDQYLIYPPLLKKRVGKCGSNTLFVVADQSLGIWIPQVSSKAHVIHCHDFLAQRSAIGEIPENPTSWIGRIYQRLIRKGMQQGKNFISVSRSTQDDLHRFLNRRPAVSEVVYNGLNDDFAIMAPDLARKILCDMARAEDLAGFVLHVGGNQWYKNRLGVVAVYGEYCKLAEDPLPLWLVGAQPTSDLERAVSLLPPTARVRFQVGLNTESLCAAYNVAKVFLFPSLGEGFGWPIAEALACGVRVITTGVPPMTEVGGDVAYYLPRGDARDRRWAVDGANLLCRVLAEPESKVRLRVEQGLISAQRFDARQRIDDIESVYRQVLSAC